ncbi:FAD-binding protein [Parahaliea mediterranea]|uniref:FAD-binding protein n=1 Tax=Parahaliea mediterranea TaxID=651086 RepID=A0A939DF88_9GAMM|nr:FAD-binding protein [Parahaliea mediterranea]MBN7796974.1 FAD-binding protein [Parahaliea mediterranea]
MGNRNQTAQSLVDTVLAPRVIEEPDSIAWDDTADVVIVGFGGAGAAAAIQAREEGASVLALERFQGGGATMLSGGVIYSGGGTRQQREAGIEDSPENMFRYLKLETQGCVSDTLLREFCEGSTGDLEWLEKHGLEFPGNAAPEKTSYPRNPYFLYYSGNEGTPVAMEQAEAAPRGHRHRAAGQAGTEFFLRLKDAALALGARLVTQTRVQRLVVDGEGRVLGVEASRLRQDSWAARKHKWIMWCLTRMHAFGIGLMRSLTPYFERLEASVSEPYCVRARGGVILATGGFIANKPMTRVHIPKYAGTMRNGTPGCDGSGILLGQSVGGSTRMMDRASAWRFINPPKAFAQGIIVNARGERYCNEGAYGAQIGHYMCEHNDGKGWIILDDRLFAEAKGQLLPWKVLPFQSILYYQTMYTGGRKADSLEALAADMGFDPEILSREVADYNRAVRGEVPDPQRKGDEFHREIVQAPFHALNISKSGAKFPLAVLTFGGLAVDENTSGVQREDGSIIDGLYAVGRAAAGLPSSHYMSGFAIADCIFTGRKVARAAAR